MAIEEEIFYPAFKEAGKKNDDEKMYFEALEEHRAAGDLIASVQCTSTSFDGGGSPGTTSSISPNATMPTNVVGPRSRPASKRAEVSSSVCVTSA